MKNKALFYFTSLFIFIGVGVLFTASCQFGIKVWVVPGSTADNLVFGFSDTRSSSDYVSDLNVSVYSCETWKGKPGAENLAYWVASVPDNISHLSTNRFTYGKEEFGLKNITAPKPLAAPGCYVLSGSGKDKHEYRRGIHLTFSVATNGMVLKK